MKAQSLKKEETNNALDLEPVVIPEERSFILLGSRPRKKIDETISSPHQYISRYHYETKDLGRFLELCPHCRKPSIDAFHSTVVNTAIDYLTEKQDQRDRKANRRRILFLAASLIGIAGSVYYLFFHVISGFRI